MFNCLFCYEPVKKGEYHARCSKKFFGITETPTLELDKEKLNNLAQLTINKRLALTGVQPKLSLGIDDKKEEKRLTLVGLWGDYILKPQSPEFPNMPEIEDLTMHLAKLFKIETADHALMRTSIGELVYITKRFDREKKEKIHVEDMCQLSELLTEQKYKSSYERIGKVLRKYVTNLGLDTIKYFRLVLFCFLTGNNDMHLKNFSLMHTDKGILLSPAYDLLNINLIFPSDKEDLALTLNGKKKRIKRLDFDKFAENLKISEQVRNNIYKDFSAQIHEMDNWIEKSFLTKEFKKRYSEIIIDKFERLDLY